MSDTGVACRLCGTASEHACPVRGRFSGREFELRRCPACRFVFLADPWLDYEAIYDERYYRGEGADSFVDYAYDAEHPDTTIRRHEWQGIFERVSALTPVGPGTAWLDYGCGTGGLVRYLNESRLATATGTEQGWAVKRLEEARIPLLHADELPAHAGRFDVVSAIEVIEHTLDPVAELRKMRELLRPGGLLFMTTGNAAPFAERLAKWRYVTPEVHMSYFEPSTLGFALEQAGFTPEYPGRGPGWDSIIRFKLLRTIGRHDVSPLERVVPWKLGAWLIDRRLQLSAQPVGRAGA